MSDEKPSEQAPISQPPASELEDAPDSMAMRSLLQNALPKAPEIQDGEIVQDVQRTLRTRSRGKFYGDGWSTSQARTSYLLIAVGVVLLIAMAYFAMVPGALFGV